MKIKYIRLRDKMSY